jgi:hypothetical protein
MKEHRKEPRERCFARVMIEKRAIYGYLCEISGKGFRMRIPQTLRVQVDSPSRFVISLGDMGILPFSLSADLIWRKNEGRSTLLGFELLNFESEESKKFYMKLMESYKIE